MWAGECFHWYQRVFESFTHYSGHNLVVPLINSKDMSEITLRYQRMLIRMRRYKPIVEHRPGKTMVTSDTVSRSPTAYRESSKRGRYTLSCQHRDILLASLRWEVEPNQKNNVSLKTVLDYIANEVANLQEICHFRTSRIVWRLGPAECCWL